MAIDLESIEGIDHAIDIAVGVGDGGMFRRLIDIRRGTIAEMRGRPAATPGKRSALTVTMEALSARCRRLASEADRARIAAVMSPARAPVRTAEDAIDKAAREGRLFGLCYSGR